MWILAKVSIAGFAFIARLFSRTYSFLSKELAEEFRYENITGYIKPTTAKNGKVTHTTFFIPFRCSFSFKLTLESDTDRFFKQIGLAQEIQSGDRVFDQKIYIACDSLVFANKITNTPEVRSLMLELFEAGCRNIHSDGSYLAVAFYGDRTQEISLGERLAKIYKQIFDLNILTKRFPFEPFAIQAIVIESIIWFIAAYAIGEVVYLFTAREDVHLYPQQVLRHGLVFGLILAALLVSLIAVFMKGSSRGHRIIVESAIVLVLSLPITGVGLVADQNVSFDKNPPVLISRQLYDKQRMAHRRRGGTTYTYHLYLRPSQSTEQISVPDSISVPRATFDQAQRGDTVQIEIGQGWLNHPWYKNFQFKR